jgi:hypothetical protein
MHDMLPFMARYTSTIFPVKKVVNLTAEQAKRIRDYRFAQQIDSENEAIRRLIEAGLGASGTRGGPRPGGSTPNSAQKPASADKTAAVPRAKKPTASDRQTSSAQTKEAQIRALREQGAH